MNKIPYGVLSDVHFGALDPERLENELEIFLETFRNSKWKVLFISGDLYHMKLTAGSPHMKAAMRFIAQVIVIAQEIGCKIRIIHGTLSHDNYQQDLITALDVALDVDIRVFNTVDTEELFPGFKVLYIPEEYVEDMDSYYGPYYKDNEYDIIIGHGLVDKAAFIAHLQESEETRKSAPIFPVKKLHEICAGPIYFGHIHRHMALDRFRYVSSYTVWAFGEPEDKGFMMGEYDTETRTFIDAFVVNSRSLKYDTVKIKEDSPLFKKSPQEMIFEIMSTVREIMRDHVRIELHMPADYEQPTLLANMLNETIKSRNIKTKILSSFKEKMVEEIRDKVDEMMDKYAILFDKSAPIELKLSKFIEIEYKVLIPPDEVHEIITERLQ